MKKTLLLYSAFLFQLIHLHCQNLIFNGTFEEENVCTELQNTCSPIGWYATGLGPNAFDYKQSTFKINGGKRYAGIIVGDIPYKTSIQTWLVCPIQAGKQYKIRFLFKKNDNYDLLPLGLHFSNQFELATTTFHNSNIDQVSFTTDDFVSKPKKGKWVSVTKTFVAPIDAEYMCIGNFRFYTPDRNTPLPKWYLKDEWVSYYIDDVSLMPLDATMQCNTIEQSRKIVLHHYRHTHHTKRQPQKVSVRPGQNELSKASISNPIVKDTSVIVPSKEHIDTQSVNRVQIFTLPNVLFAFNSAEIAPEKVIELTQILKKIKTKNDSKIKIIGHTDNVGQTKYNEKLSFQRATTIANYLVQLGICNANQIEVIGKGASEPIIDNDSEEHRQLNRRVEIKLY